MHTTHTRVADHQKKRMICQQEVDIRCSQRLAIAREWAVKCNSQDVTKVSHKASLHGPLVYFSSQFRLNRKLIHSDEPDHD